MSAISSRFEGRPESVLVLPREQEVTAPEPVAGYSVQGLPRALDSVWIDIHRKAVPRYARPDLVNWLERYRRLSLSEGILLATEDATREPVATAGSLANPKDEMFPDGGQLGWVATVPEHRGRGLANWLCSLATIRLRSDGFKRVFVSTGEDMPEAIRVYMRLGYVPCLFAVDQRERWMRICDDIGSPFEPDRWPTLEEYAAD
ncbi:MAG: GNAT family N-acetyltransferase [Gemmatimonadetes bacterium]|nr:GNAT family N-acetyltransferase [Gemmatimonadota bacterium]